MRSIETTELKETTSTIDYAKDHLLSSCEKDYLYVVRARHQTAGRGQKQNSIWESKMDDNLLITFLFTLTPKIKPNHLAQLLAASALKVLLPLLPKLQFKWPNDLLIGEHKVAGFLGEIHENNALVSLGINIHSSPEGYKSTHLNKEIHHPITPDMLFEKIITQFNHDLSLYEKKGFKQYQELINKNLAFKNETKTVGKNSGIIDSINEKGFLMMRNPENSFFEVRTS